MTEVQQSDIYVLILGEKYGWIPPDDTVSVTHREYLTVREENKRILVFVQTCQKEPSQEQFVKEVQDYHDGYFLSTFLTPEELKDEIIKSLNQLRNIADSEPEAAFNACLQDAEEQLKGCYELDKQDGAELQVAFWCQPVTTNDIISIEKESDKYFSQMCDAGLAELKYGYNTIPKATFTAIQSKQNSLIYFENGLVIFKLFPQINRPESHFDFSFVPPSMVKKLISACSSFITGYSTWTSIKISGMDNKNFEELPELSQSSMSMSIHSEPEKEITKLFSSFNQNDFNQWVDNSIEIMKRSFM